MLENIYYINLDTREDRKKHIENELKKMKWNNYQRFNAIKHKDPRIGCTTSHLEILKKAKKENLDYVVVLEDDIQFTKPQLFNLMLKTFLKKNINYDVLLIAGNIRKVKQYDSFIYQSFFSYTTTGYLVKSHYYDTLIENIEQSRNNLLLHPDMSRQYAVDVYWNKLQEKDKWFIFIPRTNTQLASYSDIEKQHKNYNNVMLD